MLGKKQQFIQTKVTERTIETSITDNSKSAWKGELLELKDQIIEHRELDDLVQEALTFLERSKESDAFEIEDSSGDYGIVMINRGNETFTGSLWSNYNYNYDCSIQELKTDSPDPTEETDSINLTAVEFEQFNEMGYVVKEYLSGIMEHYVEEYDDKRKKFDGELDHTYYEGSLYYAIVGLDGKFIKQQFSENELKTFIKNKLAERNK